MVCSVITSNYLHDAIAAVNTAASRLENLLCECYVIWLLSILLCMHVHSDSIALIKLLQI